MTIEADIAALPPLKDIIRTYKLDARRKLGQNFLLDLNLTGRIAREAMINPDQTVIEIGPGPGGLTRAILMAGAKHVIAIEKDSRAIAALQPLVEASLGRLEIMEADALDVAIHECGGNDQPRQIIANLPYNIATPLLMGWLDHCKSFSSLTLMFQREVAERITASPNTNTFGRLSIICQWLTKTQHCFDIPPSAFVPPPKVTSSVVRLVPFDKPQFAAKQEQLQLVAKTAFNQRRKMLRASLRALGGQRLLDHANINGERRPEQLNIAEFCAIANALNYVGANRGANQGANRGDNQGD
ncbi:MAG: 16S rRNA (adenine(1518)-N(6)/adenine(1519)-N(6))-dimethyltransferase [Candidatus Puniceispirillum sp. TMED52]|nr:16S rRNA (adenine(1518)-N(6)/adenine(1519)-N(6))-dimethyltransferase [SAR116 cluster bacterium]OUU44865.1 MAG: 16S rRNA (adenine(1518)-N(6)/adenine(1519)-N(6))-dimethyltransferase [Candidatus Puniceispirillum sp. TMED52]